MRGICPICDAVLGFGDVEEAEVVVCSGCGTRLVVEEVKESEVVLTEAPEVEEDWGE